MPERLLIVEDEQHLADGLRYNLEAEGYDVDCVETGEEAIEHAGANHYAAVVLDVMLPGIDGFSVARELRSRLDFVPIIMLTARGRSEDVVEGFSAGADDYLPKPFELSVLIARIRGLIRRASWRQAVSPPAAPDAFTFGRRRIDFDNLEITVNGSSLRLTQMEAQLLKYLVTHRGKVVTRKMILEEVWGVHEDTDTRAIDNFIARLRKFTEDEPSQPVHLLTVRGVGYRFEV